MVRRALWAVCLLAAFSVFGGAAAWWIVRHPEKVRAIARAIGEKVPSAPKATPSQTARPSAMRVPLQGKIAPRERRLRTAPSSLAETDAPPEDVWPTDVRPDETGWERLRHAGPGRATSEGGDLSDTGSAPPGDERVSRLFVPPPSTTVAPDDDEGADEAAQREESRPTAPKAPASPPQPTPMTAPSSANRPTPAFVDRTPPPAMLSRVVPRPTPPRQTAAPIARAPQRTPPSSSASPTPAVARRTPPPAATRRLPPSSTIGAPRRTTAASPLAPTRPTPPPRTTLNDRIYSQAMKSYASGQREVAVTTVRRMLAKEPERVAWRLRLGQMFVEMGRRDEAALLLESGLARDPGNASLKKALRNL